MKASAITRMRDTNDNNLTLTLSYINPDKLPIGKLKDAQADVDYAEEAEKLRNAFRALAGLTTNIFVYTTVSVTVDLDEIIDDE